MASKRKGTDAECSSGSSPKLTKPVRTANTEEDKTSVPHQPPTDYSGSSQPRSVSKTKSALENNSASTYIVSTNTTMGNEARLRHSDSVNLNNARQQETKMNNVSLRDCPGPLRPLTNPSGSVTSIQRRMTNMAGSPHVESSTNLSNSDKTTATASTATGILVDPSYSKKAALKGNSGEVVSRVRVSSAATSAANSQGQSENRTEGSSISTPVDEHNQATHGSNDDDGVTQTPLLGQSPAKRKAAPKGNSSPSKRRKTKDFLTNDIPSAGSPISLAQSVTSSGPTQGNVSQNEVLPQTNSNAQQAAVTHPTQSAQQFLGNSDPCPVNWNQTDTLRILDPWFKEIYEKRSPWKVEPDYTYEEIKKDLDIKYGNTITTQAYRKRFLKTNRAVYLALGLWWKREHGGLEDLFPKPGPEVTVTSSGPVSTGSINETGSGKSTRSANGTATVNDYGTAAASANAEDTEMVDGIGVEVEPNVNVRKNSREMIQYDGPLFTIHGRNGVGEPFFRYLPLSIAAEASERFVEAIEDGSVAYSKPGRTPVKIWEIFLSCFTPEQIDRLPPFIYKLERSCSISFQYNSMPLEYTISDLIQLYILAAKLDSAKVCNLVMNALRKILEGELLTKQKNQNNASRAPRTPSILDFVPGDMNALFLSKSVRERYPAARDFWLQVLRIKGDNAFKKILEDLEEYHSVFLQEWDPSLSQEQVLQLSEQQVHLQAGDRFNRPKQRPMKYNGTDSSGSESEDSDSVDSDAESEDEFDSIIDDSNSGKNYTWEYIPRVSRNQQDSERSVLLEQLFPEDDEEFCGDYHKGCSCKEECEFPVSATEPMKLGFPQPANPPSIGIYSHGADDWDLTNWTPAPDTFQNNGRSRAENEAFIRGIMANIGTPFPG